MLSDEICTTVQYLQQLHMSGGRGGVIDLEVVVVRLDEGDVVHEHLHDCEARMVSCQVYHIVAIEVLESKVNIRTSLQECLDDVWIAILYREM